MNIDYVIGAIAFIIIASFIYLNNLRKIRLLRGNKRKRKEVKDIIEIKYLIVTHGLNKDKLLTKKIVGIISVIDAFIITTVFLVITLLPYGIFWQLLLGFALLLGLIYSIYDILGRILIKKGYDK